MEIREICGELILFLREMAVQFPTSKFLNMVPSLRKKHRLTWIVLAVLLPVGFVAAVLVIPQPVYQDELPQLMEEPNQTIPAIDEPTQQ